MLESVVGMLWGLTMTGGVLVFWPLAYASYWLLAWLD